MIIPGPLKVSAGIIERDDGCYLLARRPRSQSHPGFWEFPGGKQEPEESCQEALVRELYEEIGIQVTKAYPLITKHLGYIGSDIILSFWRVTGWKNDPRGLEDQLLFWQNRRDPIQVSPLLSANVSVANALSRPQLTVILDDKTPIQYIKRELSKIEIEHQVFWTPSTPHPLKDLHKVLDCPVVGGTADSTIYHWEDPRKELFEMCSAWQETPAHDHCILLNRKPEHTMTLPIAYYIPASTLDTDELKRSWEMGAWGIYVNLSQIASLTNHNL